MNSSKKQLASTLAKILFSLPFRYKKKQLEAEVGLQYLGQVIFEATFIITKPNLDSPIHLVLRLEGYISGQESQ